MYFYEDTLCMEQMYTIRLELKTNWRFIFNNDTEKENKVLIGFFSITTLHQSIITGDAKGIK